MRRQGVMMHMNERFCLGGKKARRFKKSDPQKYVPGWCPRRKNPCEWRLYGFKSHCEELLHFRLCQDIGETLLPTEHRYALLCEGRTDLSPREFWTRCETTLDPTEGILENPVEMYQVLEIDDGLKPAFFYKTERGFQFVSTFRAEIARKNKLEED
nr:hypothetical protein [uncultured Oscillibacter sp.]